MTELESVRRQLDFERRTLAPEGCILEVFPHISRIRCADPEWHMISFSSLSEDNADVIIAEQAAHYRDLAAPVEWKVYQHDTPSDLLKRLERFGFTAGPLETVLVLDVQNHLSWIDEPSTHPATRIDDEGKLDLYRHSAEVIFGEKHEFAARELLSSIKRGSTRHRGYLVMEGSTAVSIGRLYTDPQSAFGGLYGGGTLEQYRRRGFYRELVAARARDAKSAGARYLIVDALPTSRQILENLGFVRLTDTGPCTLRP